MGNQERNPQCGQGTEEVLTNQGNQTIKETSREDLPETGKDNEKDKKIKMMC